MPRYRALVSTYKSDEMAIDRITNTVYFDDQGVTTDADGLAEDIANHFANYRPLPIGWNRVNCRLYDMAEPAPREIQGEFTATTTNQSGQANGPREVALCLSFYADRNLPRNRGRLYLGPWTPGHMSERPGADPIAWTVNMRNGLANIGGVDVQWCVYSPTDSIGQATPVFKQVSAGWADDEWDTVRSRGLRAISRNAWTMEG
jgi:hypothetical protein